MGRRVRNEDDLFWEIMGLALEGFKSYLKNQKSVPKEKTSVERIRDAKIIHPEYKVLEDVN